MLQLFDNQTTNGSSAAFSSRSYPHDQIGIVVEGTFGGAPSWSN